MHLTVTNPGLESLVARGDGMFLVIAHNVSAALACTSGGFWMTKKIVFSDSTNRTEPLFEVSTKQTIPQTYKLNQPNIIVKPSPFKFIFFKLRKSHVKIWKNEKPE